MNSETPLFEAAVVQAQPELAAFLQGILGVSEASPTFTRAAWNWKCFDPHPWWPESRAYVLRAGTQIAAYGTAAPVRFERDGSFVESMQIFDWAAGRLLPAAGMLLFRKCLERSKGTLITIGGTDDASQVITKQRWFARKNDVHVFARPLKPRLNGLRTPRDVARLGRNLLWQISPRTPSAARWRARPATPNDPLFATKGDFVPIARSRSWFDYLLRCPIVKTELVILENDGQAAGHAFLAHVMGSSRVVDLVVAGAEWEREAAQAFAGLMRYIARRPDAREVVAASSLGGLCDAFLACGLRQRGSQPVYFADPYKQLPADVQLETGLIIGDAFYLYNPAYPWLC